MGFKNQDFIFVSITSRISRDNHIYKNYSSNKSLCKILIISALAAIILFPCFSNCQVVLQEIETDLLNELIEGRHDLLRWKRDVEPAISKEEEQENEVQKNQADTERIEEGTETGGEDEVEKHIENVVNEETGELQYYAKYFATYNQTDSEYVFVVELTNQYYCERYGEKHVLCALKDNVEGFTYSDRYVNDTEIDFIIRFATRLRKRLLLGKEDGGNGGLLPKASKMRRIQWSQELQVFAQRISNQCDKTLNKDIIIATDEIPALTTLIAYSKKSTHSSPRWTQALMQWYKGVKNVEPDVVFKSGKKMDSYSAMVWSKTYVMGCGYTACEKKKTGETNKYYTCIFGPAGNKEGEKIYEPVTEGEEPAQEESPQDEKQEEVVPEPEQEPAPVQEEAVPEEEAKEQDGEEKPELSTTTTKKPVTNPFKKVQFRKDYELGK